MAMRCAARISCDGELRFGERRLVLVAHAGGEQHVIVKLLRRRAGLDDLPTDAPNVTGLLRRIHGRDHATHIDVILLDAREQRIQQRRLPRHEHQEQRALLRTGDEIEHRLEFHVTVRRREEQSAFLFDVGVEFDFLRDAVMSSPAATSSPHWSRSDRRSRGFRRSSTLFNWVQRPVVVQLVLPVRTRAPFVPAASDSTTNLLWTLGDDARVRQVAVLYLEAGGRQFLGHPRLGGATVADEHLPPAAEGLERVDELVVVDLVDRGADGAAASVGVVQEAEDRGERVAGEVRARGEARASRVRSGTSRSDCSERLPSRIGSPPATSACRD